MGLHSRIEEKKAEKRGYERDLSYCQEVYEYLSRQLSELRDEIYNPDKTYDMTVSSEWLGKLERDSDDHRNLNCSNITNKMSEISTFLSNLDRTMDKLQELIRECEAEIDALEAELRARESSIETKI